MAGARPKRRKTPTERRSPSPPKKNRTHKKSSSTQMVTPSRFPGQEKEKEEVAAANVGVPDMEDFSPNECVKLRRSFLSWYDENKRALPWRDTSKAVGQKNRAYAVWVSEVMLQQTRVATVIRYYNRWMERWPTVRHLAGATQEEVNEMWAGLGYYRRARFLLEGAKSIVQTGEFPQTASALRCVQGIGNYTAGAIASIAFDEAVPVVDGNVIRVITRLKAISSNPKESATVKTIWKLAGQLVDPCRPGDFNQAVMELGATLCSTSNPSCTSCPVSDQCFALTLSKHDKNTRVTDYPLKVVKPRQRLQFAAVCVVEIVTELDSNNANRNGQHKFLLVKRPDEGLLAGLWEFPSVLINEKDIDKSLRRNVINLFLKMSFNLDIRSKCSVLLREDVGEYVHIFSHIRLHMFVELLVLSSKGTLVQLLCEKVENVKCKCVEEDSMQSLGLTSSVRKVYSMVQEFKGKRQPFAKLGKVDCKKIKEEHE